MLSKDREQLADILNLVGKRVTVQMLEGKSIDELNAAEQWAVRFNAAMQGHETSAGVPRMPDWLRPI